jgi:hypothetical protein
MVLQIFPEPSASTLNADSYTVPTALKQYKVVKNFDAAVYTIATSPSTSQATVQFDTGSSFLETTTISGTVTYNLSTLATNAILTTNTGTNVVVTITKVAAALPGAEMSGTLDTITTTSTYNQTGKLYVLAVGGGGGGGKGFPPHQGGRGGGAGAISYGNFYTNTSTSVTIGSAGSPSQSAYVRTSAGTTNFGNLLSAAGGDGAATANAESGNTSGFGITGGTVYGAANAISNPRQSIKSGTNGGGGAGATQSSNPYNGAQPGAGSGIGTGGNGGDALFPGNDATGYGAGGGGGGAAGGNNNPETAGGAGTQGVVYVLRGF